MEAPRIKSLFRNVKKEPRKFGFKPRFYDPQKEELEKRKRRIEREVARKQGKVVDDYQPGEISFRQSWNKQSAYRKGSRSANLRLIVILAFLLLFAYLAINWVENLDGWLENFD